MFKCAAKVMAESASHTPAHSNGEGRQSGHMRCHVRHPSADIWKMPLVRCHRSDAIGKMLNVLLFDLRKLLKSDDRCRHTMYPFLWRPSEDIGEVA